MNIQSALRCLAITMLLFRASAPQAQTFLKNDQQRPLTFKEMQLQFSEYRKENDLSQQKYWKHFKRYESDMQLHTGTDGEPAGFEVYVKEALSMSEFKERNRAAATPWYPVGPNAVPENLTGYMENGIGRVNCVAFHPNNPSVFFVGVAQGGIWKTSNGGASYTPLTDNLPITRITDICIDPNNVNTMYTSVCDFRYVDKGLFLNGRKRHTHYGLGVYKTTDGGSSWTPTGLTFQLTDGDASLICKIVVNPANSSQVLACGVSGMYRSTNGGTSWTKKLDSLFWDMVQDPMNPSVLYAATGWVKNANMGHAGIYKSTDFGNTWTLLTTGIPTQGSVQRIKLAIAPSDNKYIYALCTDLFSGLYGICRSTNAGTSWNFQFPAHNILSHGQGNGSGGQGEYDLAMIVDATDKNTIYTGGINLWGSTDGGASFNPISHWTTNYGNTLHGDIHNIERQPGSGDIFVCNDGGIYKTSKMQIGFWGPSWPTVWTNLSNGMQATSFYRLSSSRNTTGRLIAGSQDNATAYYDGSDWYTVFGGDGMDNYLPPENDQALFGSSQYGYFYYTPSFQVPGSVVGSNPYFEDCEWVTPVVADYNNPGVLYIGNENVVKSTDYGQSWKPLATIYSNTMTMQNTEISALAVSNTNSKVIYAARRVRYEYGINGIVFRTVDGGLSFKNITANLPDSLYYTGIEVSPVAADEAVVCMAGFSAGRKVFRTTNGGASWTNITYNLPNIPVNCIKYSPLTRQLMVATDLGVYTLDPGATSWINYSLGLPNVIVSDIEFNLSLNKVFISTFGRGIWASDLNVINGLGSEPLSALNFSILPSVNNGQFRISIPENENTRLTVIDVMGRVIHRAELRGSESQINLNVPPGTYYLRLVSNKGAGVKKMVVE